MKTYKIDGVILRTTDFGDSNRIATIYTKKFGKLELNAYGCRRARSPMAGAIQMFNHISAEVARGTSVDTIREADVINFYSSLSTSVERIFYAAVFYETVNRMTLPKFPEEGVYKLLVRSLPALGERDARLASLAGVVQFMEFSGVQLRYDTCVNCGVVISGDAAISMVDGGAICMDCVDGASGDMIAYPRELREMFEKILEFDWQAETKLEFEPKHIELAENLSWRYVQYVIGQELNTVKFLRSLR